MEFEPDIGEELSRTPVADGGTKPGWPSGPVERADGSRLVTRNDRGHVTVAMVRGDERTTLLDVTGPRDYGIWDASWSPDGRFALVTDSERRVLVIPADGSRDARALTTRADLLAWYQPAM